MTFEQQLSLARDLIARRDEIDAQLATLFEGRPSSGRSKRKCSHCGETGHRSDSCPHNQTPTPASTAEYTGGESEAVA